jgi:type I site-specific restriction endonuclease
MNTNSCFGLLLFFVLTVLFAKLYWNRRTQLQIFQARLEQEAQDHAEKLAKEIQSRESQIRILNNSIQKHLEDGNLLSRERWFRRIARVSFKGEGEVKVKFVNSLVSFLGYQESDFELEVPVRFQIGRNSNIQGKADWVLYEKTASNHRNAFVIIEVKEPNIVLDSAARDQARSYAMGLNAPIYVITNGRNIQIFRRGIQEDIRIVNCTVSNLAEEWDVINQTMGKKAGNTSDNQ